MIPLVLSVLLLAPAVVLALPAICDAWMFVFSRRPSHSAPAEPAAYPRLLFLVPAHNEETLIEKCVVSLCAQTYPPGELDVLVIADNCTDDTAAIASRAGGLVRERHSETDRGKGHAIGWALTQVQLDRYAAVVIIDADTIVEPDFALHLAKWPDLEHTILQTYDSLSNEFENWLTRLAGLFTRNRYELALPLKVRAGLSCPLTGDGIVVGSAILRRDGWTPKTITEGWELYAKYTLAGIRVGYEPRSRLYAQETSSLKQSQTQRERWTSGRLSVFGMYWREIFTAPRLSVLQRLDLIAELTSLGPIVRGLLGAVGTVVAAIFASGPVAIAGVVLYASCFIQPASYSAITLTRHPQPWPTIRAFFRLPFYAAWRALVAVRALTGLGSGKWVRTARRPH